MKSTRFVLSIIAIIVVSAAKPVSAEHEPRNGSGKMLAHPEIEFKMTIAGGIQPSASLLAAGEFGPLGIAFDSRVAEEGGHAYFGPAILFGPFMLGAPLIGATVIENRTEYRPRVAFVFEGDALSIHAFGDIGGHRPYEWGRIESVYKFDERVGIGLQADSAEGIGPRLELFPLEDVALYDVWTFNPVDNTFAQFMGVRAYLD